MPIIIGSGYRSPALNRSVGGSTTSQHMKGEAADLHLPSIAIGRQWIERLLEYGLFDQLIWEHDKSGHYWIHVSFKRIGKNRQTYIPNLLKK
uniref:D-Ala-D-Ala carboxypeptidase family metallohydrolase n=1 Tax=Segatella copri TaxID=165179 RepID=UPI003FEEB3F2